MKTKRRRNSTCISSSTSEDEKQIKRKKRRDHSSDSPVINVKKKLNRTSSSSSSSDSKDYKKTRKRRSKRDSSSDSSSSENDKKKRRKFSLKKKKKAKHKKAKKKSKKKKKEKTKRILNSNIKSNKPAEVNIPDSSDGTTAEADQSAELQRRSLAMRPMTQAEWEARQSVVRRVYDEETGRSRLVKGDGEILEEIVSRKQHMEINRRATKGDGATFQARLGLHK